VEVAEHDDTLANPDYASAFEVTITDREFRSPEQWARATFEGAPATMRWFILFGWRFVMHFRLGPRPSSTHVLGWNIVSAAPEIIVLEVRSAIATAHKVVRVEPSRVVMTTFVRYERRSARAIWSMVAPVHHRTEPYLLGHAASHPH
jgi:hypothetical protein